MMSKSPEQADEVLRRLAAALRSAQLYSARHPIIARNLEALSEAIAALHASQPSITIGIVGSEVVVGDVPVGRADSFGDMPRRLKAAGVERLVIERGVTRDEIAGLVHAVGGAESRRGADGATEIPPFPHIRVGRIKIEDRIPENLDDMATIRRLYSDAVSVAERLWDTARSEEKPDADAARAMVDGLAQAVSQNRTALLALTALKQYDNYTFTHMVNVSILTMGQARALGLDGPLLREFGLAGLMHDIGKVRTPTEILNKPESLTEAEFTIMKRHTIDGAEMLRQTPEMSGLAPIVAFEHHLRLDGTGYPTGVRRPTLNLCTMMCGIADVFDAMRSQRRYQQAFPTDRILSVLKRNDGAQFDKHLVRRFVQLLGIYPPGNLVRLNTGELAVVVRTYASDTRKPQVRVLFDRNGRRLDLTYDVNLWESSPDCDGLSSIEAPVDPADYPVDPLAVM